MLGADICRETVSILHALISGADGACVDIGTASVLTAALAFVVAVVLMQVIGRSVLNRLLRGGKRGMPRRASPPSITSAPVPERPPERGRIGAVTDDGGPIRSQSSSLWR